MRAREPLWVKPPPNPASGLGQRLRLVTTRDSSPTAVPGNAGQASAHEAAFLSNLALIDGVVRFICQRHKLSGSEAEDFSSEVRLRIVDNDYEVFRRFQQRSQPAHVSDRRHPANLSGLPESPLGQVADPSAEARRLGPAGHQARAAARARGLALRGGVSRCCGPTRASPPPNPTLQRSRSGCRNGRAAPWSAKRRSRPLPAADGAVGRIRILSEERRDADPAGSRPRSAAPCKRLATRTGCILRLKFQEGLGIADIARALHLEQKPLYRRLDGLLDRLRSRARGCRHRSAGRVLRS